MFVFFFFSSRRRHTRCYRDWSSDVCSSDLEGYLGAFTGCEGLGCEVTIEQHEEGGNNGFVYQLPGRIKYSNVKLTRAVTSEGARLVAQWFAKMAKHGIERTTAHIVAMSADGEAEIWEWTL